MREDSLGPTMELARKPKLNGFELPRQARRVGFQKALAHRTGCYQSPGLYCYLSQETTDVLA